MYKRILLKLSGEALSNQDATLDVKVLTDLLEEVKTIRDAGTKIGIVVGGGNIVRGK
ncbi:MAG: UMP kinase, partial [Erysipelotrichaceae bacterium]|nr:UMP kinase [Erysipelotrichaceae bacterium]